MKFTEYKISKGTFALIDNKFADPKTIPLFFRFEPHLSLASLDRLKHTNVKQLYIENKEIYILDHYFNEEEQRDLREFSKTHSFSRDIFASRESQAYGEKAARSMNNRERLQLLQHPPVAIQEFYKFLNTLAAELHADITTLPWDLCNGPISSPALATNFLQEVSQQSMELGKHQDFDPEGAGISFGIPILHSQNSQFSPQIFENGAPGNPWMISIMIYATDEQFKPEYGMGTAFYKKDQTLSFCAKCIPLRMVIFEGDIWHSIQKSHLATKYFHLARLLCL